MTKSKSMQLAIDSALSGVDLNHGGPFGACVIKDGKIIAVAHNTVLLDSDPTCHAEMNAIRQASKYLGSHILSGCELYTTAEPCPMCLGAICWAKIDKVYVGVERTVADKYGFNDDKFYQELKVDKQFGVMPQECENIFSKWATLNRSLY